MSKNNDINIIEDITESITNNDNNDNNDNNNKEKNKKTYSELVKKYKKLKENRQKYETIDISNFLPTIDEMLKEDYYQELLEQMGSEINKDNSVLDMAYYSTNPFTTEPGYYEDQKVFVLRVTGGISIDQTERILGDIDGDTLKFDLSKLDSGGSFNYNGTNYKNYQEYVQKVCNSSSRETLSLRFAGINAPEIIHYSPVAIYKDKKVETKTLKELKQLKSLGKECLYIPYKLNDDKTKVSDRSDSEKIKVYVDNDCYYEIVSDLKNIGTNSYIQSNSYDKDNYTIETIVAANETSKNTVVDGYKAQKVLLDLLGSGKVKDYILVLDASNQTYTRTYPTYTVYSSLYKFGDNIKNLIQAWIDATNGFSVQLARLNYAPFGVDVYGRMLGVLYVKVSTDSGDMWIDTSKYVLANTEFTEAYPDFTSSSELRNIGDGFSNVVNLKSYVQNSTRYVDNIDVKGIDSYNKKIELHKQLTGIDFTKMKDCTIMIGDSLFLIPPQNIRNVNSIDYERAPVLRGKGTMTKNTANREQLIEIDFYFYGDAGINGIEYEATLPNGEKITYYMNGLRALLSQFKLAPFLPIENTYINDILDIEVVALVNFNLSTVEEFPKLLKATLTLRDFNYTVYMPDLPINYYGNQEDIDSANKASIEQIFGKCFEWELFRYYYQRSLIQGQELSKFDFNSYEYTDYFYSHKNCLQPNDLTDNYLELYIPDEDWLKGALQYKKAIDYTGQVVSDLTLSATETQYLKRIASIQEQIDNTNSALKKLNDALKETNAYYYKTTIGSKENVINENIFSSDGKTDMKLTNTTKDYYGGKDLLRKRIHTDICEELTKNPIVSYTYTNEIFSPLNDGSKDYTIKWEINIVLNTDLLDQQGLNNVREAVKTLTGSNSLNNCLRNNRIQYCISANFNVTRDNKEAGYIENTISTSTGEDFGSIINAYYDSEDDSANPISTNQSMFDYTKYKEPKCMKFIPYLTDENGKSIKLDIDVMVFNMSNTFTEMHLKAADGYAPQYMGSSDIIVELRMTLTDENDILYNLNKLPTVITQYTKTYRRVMPCYPLKVKNSYLQTLGLNEMLIDSIQIDTVDGFPGVYEVSIRLTSVDRSIRQREALSKIDSKNYTTTIRDSSIVNLFGIQDELAKAELYPDLDLPTVYDLAEKGWKYLKYLNEERLFVDPDFYIIYSFKYTSQIIKEMLYKYIYKKYLDEDGLEKLKSQKYVFNDSYGIKMNAYFDNVLGSTFENDNEYAELYDKIIEDVDEQATNETLKSVIGESTYEEFEDLMEIGASIQYLTATGINDGWNIREDFSAVLSDTYTNQCVENLEISGASNPDAKDEDKDNKVYEEIYNMRAKAIHLIDEILKEPLTYTTDEMEKQNLILACENAVNKIFIENENGKELIKLLNGGENPKKASIFSGNSNGSNNNLNSTSSNEHANYAGSTVTPKNLFDEPNILNYIAGYLFSTAYSYSNTKEKIAFNNNSKVSSPEHYQGDKESEKNPYVTVKDTLLKETKINLHNSKINGDWNKLLEEVYDAEAGGTFGMCKISTYPIDELQLMLSPTEIVKYKYENKNVNKMYPKETKETVFCQDNAFIDPYYNKAGHRSSAGKKYKEYIIKYPTSNAEAQLRIVLLYLKRMIIEGYFFNEVDVIQGDYDTIKKQLEDLYDKLDAEEIGKALVENGTISQEEFDEYLKEADSNDADFLGPLSFLGDNAGNFINKIPLVGRAGRWLAKLMNTGEANSLIGNDILSSAFGLSEDEYKELIDELPNVYKKSYCARMIYPFIATITKYDESIMKYIRERDYSTLNTFSAAITGSCEENDKFNLFVSSLTDIGIISTDKDNSGTASTTTVSQKVNNQLMKEAFTACANDPTKYVLHSFYDMVTNDKRGRLLRAFPTYYIVFIDEGRKIGTWKLYDNFYNMSSISELQVVKSRKIPTDTCSFVMSNMYMSYTDTYDNSIYQQYVDVYGVKDIVDSIFNPYVYVTKEDAIRNRKQLKDTTVISPGVRIHVRLGYGADASKIPIVFNGKIAEIETGDVVEVICQGDGHELSNPLNALGEMTAQNFQTSQHYITKFKDIRGSFMRGGESPRNLAAKLLNAEYNGFAKVARDIFNYRFYGDNPFGIYHFGDRRYQDIFEDGETVQNLYEVTNDNLLMGYNTLINDKSSNASTPTINCTLQDKTYWEILNLCANSGDGYYAAIRDFGFRSTVCLCKANHYYAYEYRKDNGVVYEKRKPFQQFHYYDSYNDIVYNTIKATEKNMKTNAVGTWQSTDVIWGTSQDTVGPIFLDMNIYPEYQKSMTVDTGLIGGGNGGLRLGLTTHYAEQWTRSEMDTKVNKSLAEKVTTNVLRNSIKDMYEGELCIIGDSSIKPFDSMCFSDTYEDMYGTTEIETVIHNFNATTGFTTTIVPDLVTCTESIEDKTGKNIVLSSFITATAVQGVRSSGSLVLKNIGFKSSTGNWIGLFVKDDIKATVINVVESLLGGIKIAEDGGKLTASIGLSANPVGAVVTVALMIGTFVCCTNLKNSLYRFLKNIQAISVFPIYKNQRPLVAGMSGHRGSVYGYPYTDANQSDNIQSMINDIFNDTGFIGNALKSFMSGYDLESVFANWNTSLGVGEENNELLSSDYSEEKNRTIFVNKTYDIIAKEFSNRASYIQALKTQPRITKFNTSNNTSEEYLKYQIGGLYTHPDKEEYKSLPESEKKYVSAKDMTNNKKLAALTIVEEDEDIKLAINKKHSIIREFIFSHSANNAQKVSLLRESGNREVRYLVDNTHPDKNYGGSTDVDYKAIFDLPMIHEDAMSVLKIIINSAELKNCKITFASGVRVNDTRSWKSTGFSFSLKSNNFEALKKAVDEAKNNTKWYNSSDSKLCFNYSIGTTNEIIAITVYAPKED